MQARGRHAFRKTIREHERGEREHEREREHDVATLGVRSIVTCGR